MIAKEFGTVTCTKNTRTEQQIFIAKSLYLAIF